MAKITKAGQEEPLEKRVWKAAAFEELYQKLVAGEGDYAGADPEDADE